MLSDWENTDRNNTAARAVTTKAPVRYIWLWQQCGFCRPRDNARQRRCRSSAEDERSPSSMLIIWFYLPSFVQIESMNFTQRVNITQCFQCFLTLKIVCMLISLLALSGDFCRGGSMVFSFWSSVNRYSMLHHNHSSMQFPPLPTNLRSKLDRPTDRLTDAHRLGMSTWW